MHIKPSLLRWAQHQAHKGLTLSGVPSVLQLWVGVSALGTAPAVEPKAPELCTCHLQISMATLALSFPGPSHRALQILQADLTGGWSKHSPRGARGREPAADAPACTGCSLGTLGAVTSTAEMAECHLTEGEMRRARNFNLKHFFHDAFPPEPGSTGFKPEASLDVKSR